MLEKLGVYGELRPADDLFSLRVAHCEAETLATKYSDNEETEEEYRAV